MVIVSPYVEMLQQMNDEAAHIAKCARICYASDKTTDNEKMCNNLWKDKHRSMFRHAGVYYIIPSTIPFQLNTNDGVYCNVFFNEHFTYVSTNRQFAEEKLSEFKEYEVDYITAINCKPFVDNKMIYYTFVVNTGIDITRELNRKSPNAIAERSTRYVDFIKKLGIIFKKCHWMNNLNLYKTCLVKLMCKVDEWFYKISRSKYGLNLKPEDARWCLFLDTMSKAAYTYTVKDWEYIINVRLFDYTGRAHPDVKIVMQKIYKCLLDEGYTINKF